MGAGMLAGVSLLLPEPLPPACGPCPRTDVPAFDRWAIRTESDAIQWTGRGGLAALAAWSWIRLWNMPGAGPAHVRASVESVALAVGVTALFKELADRRRPVWFTPDASAVASRDGQRSFPSGDTGMAFAVATSALLSGRGNLRSGERVLLVAGAAAVGVSRVLAGRHFPSDVLAGAAVGAASALAVHAIRF